MSIVNKIVIGCFLSTAANAQIAPPCCQPEARAAKAAEGARFPNGQIKSDKCNAYLARSGGSGTLGEWVENCADDDDDQVTSHARQPILFFAGVPIRDCVKASRLYNGNKKYVGCLAR